MRPIVNSTYVTLDGVIQNPQDWPSLGSFSAEGNQIQAELLERCDAVLMGRRTYDGFAPVWTARSGDPASDRMNAIRKYVVSTTLTDPQWHNTTVIDHDPIEAIRDLKQQPGGALVVFGGVQTVRSLVAAGLVDEFWLKVNPVAVGHGGPIFADLQQQRALELVSARSFPSGTVALIYTAAK